MTHYPHPLDIRLCPYSRHYKAFEDPPSFIKIVKGIVQGKKTASPRHGMDLKACHPLGDHPAEAQQLVTSTI